MLAELFRLSRSAPLDLALEVSSGSHRTGEQLLVRGEHLLDDTGVGLQRLSLGGVSWILAIPLFEANLDLVGIGFLFLTPTRISITKIEARGVTSLRCSIRCSISLYLSATRCQG
jgi:hypothetical protein